MNSSYKKDKLKFKTLKNGLKNDDAQDWLF